MSVQMFKGVNPDFHECCNLGEVKPTRRQFKKWQRGTGKAKAKLPELKRIEADRKRLIDEQPTSAGGG